jgi:SNF2 family DNA or RNA helicase
MAEITRLQDKCPYCGKTAKAIKETTYPDSDPNKPDLRYIVLECKHLIVRKIPKASAFETLESYDHKKLYPFQIQGARFIEEALSNNNGAAIFDEMGLGKTPQSLAYLKFHAEAFPVLFILKSGIKFQWAKEIIRWLDDMHVPQVINTSNDYVIPNLKCYIASFDIFTPKTRKGKTSGFDYKKFVDRGIKTIVIDECQQIKNPDATRTQMIRRLIKDTNARVIALSGTPWKNRGSEFFTILNILAPMKFPTYQGFLNKWVDYYYHGNQLKMGGINDIPKFREYIKDIAIRREIFEVALELPSVNRTLFYTELNSIEQREYDDSVSEFVKWYNDAVIGGEEENISTMNILAKMSRMRHITGLAKIPATEEFVEEFIEETERKLVIFVHHQDVGQILYQNLHTKFSKEIPVFSLTSSLSPEERFNVQEKFNNSQRAILIASTLASGEGLNLQTCADAIMHERQWNPANEDQAAPGRFRRIGSDHKQVNVTFMTASGTIDEFLGSMVEQKRERFHATMNKGESVSWNESGLVNDLAASIANDWNKKNKNDQVADLKKWASL